MQKEPCENSLELRALERCRQRIDKLKECFRTSGLILSSLQLDEVLESIMTVSRSILNAEACSLLLVDEDSGDLVFQIAQGPAAHRLKEGFRVKKGEGIAGHVHETGRPLRIQSAYQDSRFQPAFDRQTGFHTRSILCVPLQAHGRVTGVTQAINRTDGNPFDEDDEEILSLLSTHAAIAIENARMHQALLLRRQVECDLSLASTVQQSFLPLEVPLVEGFQFFAHTEAALQVGGDFYDFIPLPGNQLGILIGDVSGKGIASALFMAKLTSDFRFAALKHQDPARVVTEVNNLLCRRSRRGMFATLLYGVLDSSTRSLRYVNAGHLPPLLWNRERKRAELLPHAEHPPAGILPGTEHTAATLQLAAGDCVIFCTDGVIEAKNTSGERLGWEYLQRAIEAEDASLEELSERLIDLVRQFSKNCPPADDTTVLIFGVEAP